MQPTIFFEGQPSKILNEHAVRQLAAINEAVRQARRHGVLLAVAAIHIDCDPPRVELINSLPADLLDLASNFLSQRQPDGQYRARARLFGIEWAWLAAFPLAHQSTTVVPMHSRLLKEIGNGMRVRGRK